AGFSRQFFHFRINMTIHQKDIGPSVVVYIDETTTPAEPARIESHSCWKRNVVECRLAGVSIERRSITGEVGLEDIEPPIMVVIRCCYTHSRLWLTVDTQSATCFDTNVRESSIFIVAVQRCRSRIVSDVDIHPAVIVQIHGKNTETVGSVRLGNSGLL